MSTDSVLEEVRAEREGQKLRYSDQHDDEHNPGEWFGLIQRYTIRGLSAMVRKEDSAVRFSFLVIAALAVATIETIDRECRRRPE